MPFTTLLIAVASLHSGTANQDRVVVEADGFQLKQSDVRTCLELVQFAKGDNLSLVDCKVLSKAWQSQFVKEPKNVLELVKQTRLMLQKVKALPSLSQLAAVQSSLLSSQKVFEFHAAEFEMLFQTQALDGTRVAYDPLPRRELKQFELDSLVDEVIWAGREFKLYTPATSSSDSRLRHQLLSNWLDVKVTDFRLGYCASPLRFKLLKREWEQADQRKRDKIASYIKKAVTKHEKEGDFPFDLGVYFDAVESAILLNILRDGDPKITSFPKLFWSRLKPIPEDW